MTSIAIAVPIAGFEPAELDRRRALVEAELPPGLTAEFVTAEGAPRFLDAHEHFTDAIGAAIDALSKLDADRYSVIVSAGALDPGLARARAACPIPIVGPGEASLYLAAIVGKPLAVVTVDEFAVRATETFLDGVAVKPPIVGIRSMDLPVRELVQDLDVGRRRLIESCTLAVREGAEALYLGSMTLGTLGVGEQIADTLGVPVFNPIPISVATAVRIALVRPRAA